MVTWSSEIIVTACDCKSWNSLKTESFIEIKQYSEKKHLKYEFHVIFSLNDIICVVVVLYFGKLYYILLFTLIPLFWELYATGHMRALHEINMASLRLRF